MLIAQPIINHECTEQDIGWHAGLSWQAESHNSILADTTLAQQDLILYSLKHRYKSNAWIMLLAHWLTWPRQTRVCCNNWQLDLQISQERGASNRILIAR